MAEAGEEFSPQRRRDAEKKEQEMESAEEAESAEKFLLEFSASPRLCGESVSTVYGGMCY
jgi:hypothetical protein